jgi:cytochrome c-type biogenesis protein CcmH
VKRWLPLLTLAVLAVVALMFGSRSSSPESPAQRADAIAARVKCPTCQGLSVAQSRTGLALAIHDEIRRQVDLGRTDAQVMGYISSKYGDGLITNPPATGAGAVVWVAPIAFLILAFVGLGLALSRWSRTGSRESDYGDPAAVARAREAAAE